MSIQMLQLTKKIIVAVDGFSSGGKSSFAKLIARNLDYVYLDSGAMYRAVSLYGIQKGIISEGKISKQSLIEELPNIEIRFQKEGEELITFLNGEPVELLIRGVEVSSVVSEVSKFAEVRQGLVQLQQELGKEKGLVMDGRDIGTVVFPEAECKIFMQADAAVRAKRRFDEMQEKGIEASLEEITRNIETRDYQDIHRDISPLRKAKDAHVLDNSRMDFNEQMIWFIDLLEQKELLAKRI